ncbi:MAG: hypothetical protein GTN35_01490 [Nitrososphaeria archaeon]|nr:hypothetical protein [Nitrosopumilaceae archaeon]NIP09446.1 hypothetical protein [Nitrosopumilaceae archaeon]NIP91078.1 hypothetical protein [Nitrososphaeria archaeon]NIS94996.1 hypothetical protein [Nitrosopumilaceae archaeon]
MSSFSPKTPIQLQIRKIIFDKFNDADTKFTNDEIFEIIKQEGDYDSSWIIDDLEPYVNEICDLDVARNIAQNFTTIYLKLFEPLKQQHCDSCGLDVHVTESEKQCPNPSCKASL